MDDFAHAQKEKFPEARLEQEADEKNLSIQQTKLSFAEKSSADDSTLYWQSAKTSLSSTGKY